MLKWILDRSDGARGGATDTPIGDVPTRSALDLRGLDLSDAAVSQLLRVDAHEWSEAVQSQETFFDSFGSHLPRAIREEHDQLARRIGNAATPADLRGRDSGT